MGAAGMSANAVGIVVFWYCVTLVFNWTAFNLVVLKDDPALALLPADITLIEMFACTICGALTLYNKGLAFIPPPELRVRMLVLALANAAACQLFMFAMDFVALSLVQTIRACQPIFTVVVGEPRSYGSCHTGCGSMLYRAIVPLLLHIAVCARRPRSVRLLWRKVQRCNLRYANPNLRGLRPRGWWGPKVRADRLHPCSHLGLLPRCGQHHLAPNTRLLPIFGRAAASPGVGDLWLVLSVARTMGLHRYVQ